MSGGRGAKISQKNRAKLRRLAPALRSSQHTRARLRAFSFAPELLLAYRRALDSPVEVPSRNNRRGLARHGMADGQRQSGSEPDDALLLNDPFNR